MSDMNIAVEGSLSKASSRGINKADLVWMLGLYGTAIGAGVLFLPINAGVGGLWPLVAMLVLALPLTPANAQEAAPATTTVEGIAEGCRRSGCCPALNCCANSVRRCSS